VAAGGGAPVEEIGPAQGLDLSAYIVERNAELTAASNERLAVISLRRYSVEPAARAIVAGKATVLALIAAPPGGEGSIVDVPLPVWVQKQKDGATTERQELLKQLATTDNAEFAGAFRADVDRLAKLIKTIRPDMALVFALVVRAPAEALRSLSHDPAVRLVDVGSSDKPAPQVRYTGVKPEETSKSEEPRYRLA